jgi:hypothetical protein
VDLHGAVPGIRVRFQVLVQRGQALMIWDRAGPPRTPRPLDGMRPGPAPGQPGLAAIPAADSSAQAISGWTMSEWEPAGGPPFLMTALASRLKKRPAANW